MRLSCRKHEKALTLRSKRIMEHEGLRPAVSVALFCRVLPADSSEGDFVETKTEMSFCVGSALRRIPPSESLPTAFN